MKLRNIALAIGALLATSCSERMESAEPADHSALLHDSFSGASVNADLWSIPTRDPASGDGTFVGRTQFRTMEDSSLPAITKNGVCMPIQTYSRHGDAFFAAEMISKQTFSVGSGLDIVVRARMRNADSRGIVGGIFLYSLEPGGGTLHDELDFELLTNLPRMVQTNIYGHEPLGEGHVKLITLSSGAIDNWHTYEMQWLPDKVSWLVDGRLVRTTTSNLPTHPMNFYFNIWAPDHWWPEGYSDLIQPTNAEQANVVLNALCVKSITIRPIGP